MPDHHSTLSAPRPAVTARAPRPKRRWIDNRPTRGWLPLLQVRELWAYRDVGIILAERDVRVRYKQTFFGVAWAILQPLSAMGVFTLIIGKYTGVSSDGVPYAAFALAGLAIWFPLSSAVLAAAESLVRDPELVAKVYFPRLLARLGAVLATMVDLAVSLAIAQLVALLVARAASARRRFGVAGGTADAPARAVTAWA